MTVGASPGVGDAKGLRPRRPRPAVAGVAYALTVIAIGGPFGRAEPAGSYAPTVIAIGGPFGRAEPAGSYAPTVIAIGGPFGR